MARELGVTLDFLVNDSIGAESTDHFVVVTQDEWTVLKMVRRLGVEVSLDRLLQVAEPPAQPPGDSADVEMSIPRSKENNKRDPNRS